MKNEELWLRLRRVFKNAPTTLHYSSNFLLHYHFVLSFFIHRQHFHFCHHCKSNVHYPIPVGAAACRARYPDFLHFHKHRQPRTIPHPALPQFQIRAIGATLLKRRMKNEKLWRRFQRVLKTHSTTFHYFQTSYFTITLYYPFLSTANISISAITAKATYTTQFP